MVLFLVVLFLVVLDVVLAANLLSFADLLFFVGFACAVGKLSRRTEDASISIALSVIIYQSSLK